MAGPNWWKSLIFTSATTARRGRRREASGSGERGFARGGRGRRGCHHSYAGSPRGSRADGDFAAADHIFLPGRRGARGAGSHPARPRLRPRGRQALRGARRADRASPPSSGSCSSALSSAASPSSAARAWPRSRRASSSSPWPSWESDPPALRGRPGVDGGGRHDPRGLGHPPWRPSAKLAVPVSVLARFEDGSGARARTDRLAGVVLSRLAAPQFWRVPDRPIRRRSE